MLDLIIDLEARRPGDLSHVAAPPSESFILTDADVTDIASRLNVTLGVRRPPVEREPGQPVAAESMALAKERRQSVTRLAVRRVLSMWEEGGRWHALYGLPVLILADSLPPATTSGAGYALPMSPQDVAELLTASGLIPAGVTVTVRDHLCRLSDVLAAVGYRLPDRIRDLGETDARHADEEPAPNRDWSTGLNGDSQSLAVRYVMVDLSAEGEEATRLLQLASCPQDAEHKALALDQVAAALQQAFWETHDLPGLQLVPLAWGMVSEYADTAALAAYERVLASHAVAVMRASNHEPVAGVLTAHTASPGAVAPSYLRVSFFDTQDDIMAAVEFHEEPMLALNEVSLMLMVTLQEHGLAHVEFDRRLYVDGDESGRKPFERPGYWRERSE